MKKIIASIASMAIFLLFAFPVLAVKPTGTGAENVRWNLSGDVMPSPPWGLSDIEGSDTASKLIVNQPNGNVEVAVTGVMNGLNPNSTYQVFPSRAWSTSEEWNIVGEWDLSFMYGTNYDHRMIVTFQNMHTGAFTGTGFSTTYPGKFWDIEGTSNVVGNNFTLDLAYIGSTYTVHAEGTIDTAGTIIDGAWSSSTSQNGTWSSISGAATKETVGNGYPGLFAGQTMFTFVTDEFGHGSWHFNLRNEDFSETGTYNLSVWINRPGATILVSDNFEVIVD